ncbi:MAG: hypothetical protein Kow00104_04730 [Rhodothalassiaceae bacterium]
MAGVSRGSGLIGSLKAMFGMGAAVDPLDRQTGLPTRRALHKAIEEGPTPCSLFLLAIDNLDELRPRYGEEAVDQAYRFVATRLSIFCRGRLFRVGENRFATLYPRQPLAGTESDMAAAVGRLGKLPFRVRSVSRPAALSREEAMTLRGDAFEGEEMFLRIRYAGVGAESAAAAANLLHRAEEKLKAAAESG